MRSKPKIKKLDMVEILKIILKQYGQSKIGNNYTESAYMIVTVGNDNS